MTILEELAEEYARRVTSHDIDSIRYAMSQPYNTAKADFLAGWQACMSVAEGWCEEVTEDRDGHRPWSKGEIWDADSLLDYLKSCCEEGAK